MACETCSKAIITSTVAVSAARAGPCAVWHPKCFICSVCGELLVDLVYFYDGGRIYCGRHHAEVLKPRCSACDELIFTEEYTEAEGQAWHIQHFRCTACQAPLGGARYIMRLGNPHCVRCFNAKYADRCAACTNVIEVDSGRMSHDGRHWHANKNCFSCTTCQISLVGKPFLPRHASIFCSTECIVEAPSSSPAPSLPKKQDKAAKSLRMESKPIRASPFYVNTADFMESDIRTLLAKNLVRLIQFGGFGAIQDLTREMPTKNVEHLLQLTSKRLEAVPPPTPRYFRSKSQTFLCERQTAAQRKSAPMRLETMSLGDFGLSASTSEEEESAIYSPRSSTRLPYIDENSAADTQEQKTTKPPQTFGQLLFKFGLWSSN